MNITAEEYLEGRTKWFEYVQEDLIETSHARIAIAMARSEMKQKAIESYIENCEYKSDWCCGCAEAHGAILAEPDVCRGKDCPSVKQFIEKLNSW